MEQVLTWRETCYSATLFNMNYEELNDLYPSHNIVQVIKSRRMRWVWHVAHGGEQRFIQGFGRET